MCAPYGSLRRSTAQTPSRYNIPSRRAGGRHDHTTGTFAAVVRAAHGGGSRRAGVRAGGGGGGRAGAGAARGDAALHPSDAEPADARLAALPVGQGDDPGRLERRRRAAHVVGSLLEPGGHQLPALRLAELLLRAAGHGRPDAGLARGVHAHRRRAGEPLPDALGRRGLADPDRRGPAARELPAARDGGDSRAPARALQPHRLDSERGRPVGPGGGPDRLGGEPVLPRLVQPAPVHLQVRLGRRQVRATVQRDRLPRRGVRVGPSPRRGIPVRAVPRAPGRPAVREHEDLVRVQQRRGPRVVSLRPGVRPRRPPAGPGLARVRPRELHGGRGRRQPGMDHPVLRSHRQPQGQPGAGRGRRRGVSCCCPRIRSSRNTCTNPRRTRSAGTIRAWRSSRRPTGSCWRASSATTPRWRGCGRRRSATTSRASSATTTRSSGGGSG